VIGEIANVVRLGARQRREGAIWGFGKIGCRDPQPPLPNRANSPSTPLSPP
jgi:hypothetical protein